METFDGCDEPVLGDVYFADEAISTISCVVHLEVPSGQKPESGLDVSVSSFAYSFRPTITEDEAWVTSSEPTCNGSSISFEEARFKAKVETQEYFRTDGYGYGSWCFVQLVLPGGRKRTIASSEQTLTACIESPEGLIFSAKPIDFRFPYEPFSSSNPDQGDEEDSWKPDGTSHDCVDAPSESGMSLTETTLPDTLMIDEHFKMYIMYKPKPRAGIGAMWVPVRIATWFWKGTVVKVGSSYNTVVSNPDADVTQDFEPWAIHPDYYLTMQESVWQ